ncbi:SPOR domain-containing protein [Paramaledivibacter caminithermalis]|jgi:hypothetical protein|uniref:Sporulation related domain-containing protein n=1 Tax=Paramaledivibacter caminithermalis (strain DSM 15212 / CIP 107654 / DViRD3) TaxID=1121301 RepID=A0A1M6MED3_PARC5|nr:SPOR domain-containing protein [Paramaledivibacter caminithermalis]SHJ81815.1 Sporulation related domain-containing protein [Paramaledivibacter caminithermalis DSM 15212]
MRQNRTKTRKRSQKNYITIIVLLAVLFVGAPTIGYFGTKYILIPRYFNNQDSNTASDASNTSNEEFRKKIEEKTKVSNDIDKKTDEKTNINQEQSLEEKKYTFDVPALSIYSIQVGSFDNKEHANNQVKDLNNKGLGGYILQSDRFKVVAMSFTERSNAEKFKEIIKEHYSDAFISPKQLSTRTIKYGEKGKKYSEAAAKSIGELMKYYESFSSFLSQNDILNGDSNEITQFINNEINRLEVISNSISSANPSEDFTSFNNKLSNIVETAKTKLIQLKKSNISDRKQLFEIYMESINSYEDIL